jgi:hypothetical protein
MTRSAWLGAWLAASLVVWAVAHVALAIGLMRNKARWWRGGVALVVPPLAPAWGWSAGMRRTAYAWALAVVAYAMGVALAR